MKAPILLNPPAIGDKKFSQGPLLLTPPPEAMQTASMLLMNSTLAPEERSLIAAYTPRTPAGSDMSLSSRTTAGAAVALTDLPEQHDSDFHSMQQESTHARLETLIDLEGGTDMFASTEDDMDLSMQWLQGFDADKLTPNTGGYPSETIEDMEESSYAEQALDISDELAADLDI